MLRRTAALVALTLAASLAAAINSPANAADPTLVVPDAPSGDVVVTATADPATASYLAVRLILGTAPTAPYDGIDPTPVANPGGLVEVTIPSWGLHQDEVTFVLLGCGAADPATCTAPLASQERVVTQTAQVAVTFEVPTEPVFVPEEKVYVTATGGGGRLVADSVPTVFTVRQPLESGVRTEVVLGTDLSTTVPTTIRRCSTLVPSTAYCESVHTRRIKYYEGPNVDLLLHNSRITVNPSWTGSRLRAKSLVLALAGPTYTYTWELLDTAGHRVIGPRRTTRGELVLVPGAHATGQLADGRYRLRYVATARKGGMVKTDSDEQTITLINNPPEDVPRIYVASRVSRGHRAPASFRVHYYKWTQGRGIIRLRDVRGVMRARRSIPNPCGQTDTFCVGLRWGVVTPTRTIRGRPLPRGIYRAEFLMPDSWGRPIVRRLGKVYVR